MPEGCAASRGTLIRQGQWADRNLVKFSQEKCKILHLERNSFLLVASHKLEKKKKCCLPRHYHREHLGFPYQCTQICAISIQHDRNLCLKLKNLFSGGSLNNLQDRNALKMLKTSAQSDASQIQAKLATTEWLIMSTLYPDQCHSTENTGRDFLSN